MKLRTALLHDLTFCDFTCTPYQVLSTHRRSKDPSDFIFSLKQTLKYSDKIRSRPTLHEDVCTYMKIFRSFFRKRNISDKSCRVNQNTHFMFSTFFFRKSLRFQIMWKNIIASIRLHMTIRLIRISRWLPKTKNMHLVYVILTAVPLKRWLHDRTSLLRYTYIACPVRTLVESVYCAVRTGFHNKLLFVLKRDNLCLLNV
jgi:hypothetical protein